MGWSPQCGMRVWWYQFRRSRLGVCEANNFRGIIITLTSTVSKVLCTVLNNRLSSLAEEEGLIADEQVGFQKHMGCRDQLLTVVHVAGPVSDC